MTFLDCKVDISFPFPISHEDTFTLLIVNPEAESGFFDQEYYYILNTPSNKKNIEEYLEYRNTEFSYELRSNLSPIEVYFQMRIPTIDFGQRTINPSLIERFDVNVEDFTECFLNDLAWYPQRFACKTV